MTTAEIQRFRAMPRTRPIEETTWGPIQVLQSPRGCSFKPMLSNHKPIIFTNILTFEDWGHSRCMYPSSKAVEKKFPVGRQKRSPRAEPTSKLGLEDLERCTVPKKDWSTSEIDKTYDIQCRFQMGTPPTFWDKYIFQEVRFPFQGLGRLFQDQSMAC